MANQLRVSSRRGHGARRRLGPDAQQRRTRLRRVRQEIRMEVSAVVGVTKI